VLFLAALGFRPDDHRDHLDPRLPSPITFFEHVPVSDFLTDTMWTPLFSSRATASCRLLLGTVTTSLVALVVAVPLGTVIAIYLSEFASPRVREIVKPFLELLGGVPTIVYGYFALTVVTPLLQAFWPELPGFSMLVGRVW
jgi:phosphate transport system permease protein